MSQPISPPYIENVHAPEVYASYSPGVANDGANIKISFASQRASHDPAGSGMVNVVIGRLVMPMAAAIGMANTILAFAASEQAKATNNPSLQ